ncbi:hypothetical protein B0T20DRAFT_115189 [Sordaria brevicollis]|uniref:Apple domain-containing protein n=1 Tax=Sordaria brevicollis TaxID=83679 RepID=A0AAE0PKB1_SORBR|nr:hypothetical protein B0T20DRAFT_115189 [Sordaria brevicollis]
MSRTQWDEGLHVVNAKDAPEAVVVSSQRLPEPVSTATSTSYPQYSPLVQPYSSGEQEQEQRGHFLPQSGASSPDLEKSAPKRRICGLRRPTFFLTVALLAVIVIAAVGGGVGGSLAVKNAKSSSASSPSSPASTTVSDQLTSTTPPSSTTTSSSTTTASIITVPTVGVLAFDCAAVASSGKQIITMGSLTYGFSVGCNQDFTGNGIDLAGTIAYSFEDCLRSCAQTNRITKNDTCVGVSFNGDLPLFMEKYYGNCFLKKYLTRPKSDSRPLAAVASLVSSPLTG